MGYKIVNLLDNQTIEALNSQFNLHIIKNIFKGEVTLCTVNKTLEPNIKRFNFFKKLMEEDDEVLYNKQTY